MLNYFSIKVNSCLAPTGSMFPVYLLALHSSYATGLFQLNVSNSKQALYAPLIGSMSNNTSPLVINIVQVAVAQWLKASKIFRQIC